VTMDRKQVKINTLLETFDGPEQRRCLEQSMAELADDAQECGNGKTCKTCNGKGFVYIDAGIRPNTECQEEPEKEDCPSCVANAPAEARRSRSIQPGRWNSGGNP